MIGKWWWRFRVEDDALWVKVIKSIHGRDGGWRGGKYRRYKGVWGDIIKVGVSMDKIGVDFTKSFHKKIGEGERTAFWEEA